MTKQKNIFKQAITADRLFNNSNNVYIDIEKVERLGIVKGETIVTKHQIVVQDDSDEMVVAIFPTLKEVFSFLQSNTYRDIIKMTEREGENHEKYIGIAECSGGFFFSGDAYGLDELDTYHIEKLVI